MSIVNKILEKKPSPAQPDLSQLSKDIEDRLSEHLAWQENPGWGEIFKGKKVHITAPELQQERRFLSIAALLVRAETLNLLQAALHSNQEDRIDTIGDRFLSQSTKDEIANISSRLHSAIGIFLDEMLEAKLHHLILERSGREVTPETFFSIHTHLREKFEQEKQNIRGRMDALHSKICGDIQLLVEKHRPRPEVTETRQL